MLEGGWGWMGVQDDIIQQDSAQNHTNTHALFQENPGRQPGQNIINAPLSTKDHSTPQTVSTPHNIIHTLHDKDNGNH